MKRFAPIAAILLSLLLYVVVFAQDIEGTVNKGANLRAGPGTTYAVVGKATQGQAVTITDKNVAGDWYQLDTGEWIAAFLVTLDAPPMATATPTRRAGTPTATKVISPTVVATSTPQLPKINLRNDPASMEYVRAVDAMVKSFGISGVTFGYVMREYVDDSSVLSRSTWQLRFFDALSDLQSASITIREFTPTVYLMDAHSDLLKMADNIDASVMIYTEAATTGEITKFITANTALRTAMGYTDSARNKMKILLDTSSVAVSPAPTVVTQPARNEVEIYMAGVGVFLTRMGPPIETLILRFNEFSATPSILYNMAWRTSFSGALADLRVANDVVRKLTPPSSVADMHSDLLMVVYHLDNAINLYTAGMDNVDASMIYSGTDQITLAVSFLQSFKNKKELLID